MLSGIWVESLLIVNSKPATRDRNRPVPKLGYWPYFAMGQLC